MDVRKGRGRGVGSIFKPTYRAKDGTPKEAAIWWIRYSVRGQRFKESSGSTRRQDAVNLLRRRLEEVARHGGPAVDAQRTTLKDLISMLEADYEKNGRHSLGRVRKALKHVKAHFGEELPVLELTVDRIDAYTVARLQARAAPATVNRELAALRRMLRLGERAGKVLRRPPITMLEEHNTRTGFFEATQYHDVFAYLPDYLQPVITTAYITGWRVTSEILTRRWHHVDFPACWLRLEPGETKNAEGRMFLLVPDLRAALERQRTDALERAHGVIIPWVFHRNGQPIRDFRTAWRNATKAAGLPGRIPHDFRRTAVRNLERAGVPRSAAMRMVGHRTEAIYRRYAIVDEAMLRDAGQRLATFMTSMDQVGTKSGRVVALQPGSRSR